MSNPYSFSMKYRDLFITVLGCIILFCAGVTGANSLDDKIRAAESDIKVICLVNSPNQIQWSALMYMNQRFGAEVFIGLIQPSQSFGCISYDSPDGQFHVAPIGRPADMENATLVDSISAYLFKGGYPDIAIFAAASQADSSMLSQVLQTMQTTSRADMKALTNLERIFVYGRSGTAADVVLNDAELFGEYKEKAKSIAESMPVLDGLIYTPERFRWYYQVTVGTKTGKTDFLSGIDKFRLPEIIMDKAFEGPERKNLLSRVERFRSYIRASYHPRLGPSEKLKLLLSAYAEVTRFVNMIESGTGDLAQTRVLYRAKMVKYKTSLAVSEAIGVEWKGNLVLRDTPFGKSGKLQLELDLSGSLPVELSYFKFHPRDGRAVIIDSISTVIQPHQKLFRKYPISFAGIDLSNARTDSNTFSIELVIEGLSMDLFVSYDELGNEDISIEWLPGYAILSPFKDGDITSLAQTFDWQVKITKPHNSEFKGRLEIDNPDAIVVGSYNKNIEIPVGLTTKYIDIYLAAGRSIGYDKEKVTARLTSGGKTVASTAADVRIVRSQIPDTRDIAFIPDQTGMLEDFLRMAKVSFKPFTEHSLVRASLEAYDLIVIGENASDYYGVLRSVNSRLRQFVKNGGDILILGQPFGWPQDLFEFPIYSTQNSGPVPSSVKTGGHHLLLTPYTIKTNQLLENLPASKPTWSAIIDEGTEIVSAGEHGSYLRVSTIGDGRIIYCGLPLLEMAAELDIEAIHLLTNLMNFGHGNK